ncbi:MAG: hypothetical protein ABJF10_18785 [Chthoniobacter sp.]|uniref:hypothetical protein n=1 Tax=Chthoniobacter sp. TaxID=2510640 RepID=UPI0032ACA07E
MKSPLLPIAAILAVVAGLAGTLRAENDPISIRVEQFTKSDMNPKDIINRNHSRTVNVFVTNNSGEVAEVKIKRIVFGRGLLRHDLVTLAEGETPYTAKPHTTEKVGTGEATVTSVEQHWDKKAKKMIDATGATIVGIGVQVFQGANLVAEFYDPPSMKEQWGKTMPMPGTPLAAAKAKPPAAPPAKK